MKWWDDFKAWWVRTVNRAAGPEEPEEPEPPPPASPDPGAPP